MADITMCSGKGCNRSDKCYRHTAPYNEHWQSTFVKPPINDDGSCDSYWDNSKWQQLKSTAKRSTKSSSKKC
jgi:hypothetical protein